MNTRYAGLSWNPANGSMTGYPLSLDSLPVTCLLCVGCILPQLTGTEIRDGQPKMPQPSPPNNQNPPKPKARGDGLRRCRAVRGAKGHPNQPYRVPRQRPGTAANGFHLPCTKPKVCTRRFADHTNRANGPPLIKLLSVPRQGDTHVTAAGFRLAIG